MAKIDTKTLAGRARADRRLLALFSVVLVLAMTGGAVGMLVEGPVNLGGAVTIATGAFETAFILAGILSTVYYMRSGVVSGRTIMKRFMIASVVISAIIVAGAAVVIWSGLVAVPDAPSSALELAPLVAGLFFGSWLGAFIVLLAGLVIGMGAIGVMAALARIVTPRILAEVARSERKTFREKAVAWLFCIPDALDVRSLSIGGGKGESGLQWEGIKKAIAWEMVLGVVLCVYVSFNTLEGGTDAAKVYNMFSLLISLSVFVPMVVLPWFIFLGLDAKLKGTAKDFTLYDGVKSRVFRSYIAIGTLLVFVRLMLSKVEAGTYLLGFAEYLVCLAGISLAFTLVYFNFFDHALGDDIAAEFDRIMGRQRGL